MLCHIEGEVVLESGYQVDVVIGLQRLCFSCLVHGLL